MAMAAGKPPDDRTRTNAQRKLEDSTSVSQTSIRVASPTGDDHGHSTKTADSDSRQGGPGDVQLHQGTPQGQGHGGVPRGRIQGDAGLQLDDARAGPGQGQLGDLEGGQSAPAETPAASSTAAAVVAGPPFRARRLEDPDGGPEQHRDACLTFNLGDEEFSYVAKWLTDFVWRAGSKQDERQSRSNRRKTILLFHRTTGELVGFAAWRTFEQEVNEEEQWVGEVRFLAVIPAFRRQGVATQIWSTTREAIVESERGSPGILILIEVDAANAGARAAYESWGFEYSYSHESDGKHYDVLVLHAR